jgi:hypothetical protein
VIRATWDRGRAYCGRDGCRNRGWFVRRSNDEPGRYSIGDRWEEYDETGTLPRLHRIARKRWTPAPDANLSRDAIRAMRAAARGDHLSRTISLPIVMDCPVCATPNEVAEPNGMG